MIIGVDAGALSITDERLKVGVYRITIHLLIELSKIDKKNSYKLYSFQPIKEGIGEMENVVLPQKGFHRVWLPLELRRHPVDVFLGLSQSLPRSAAYSIGFVYDLGFLHYPEAYPDSYKKLQKLTQDTVSRANHIITISKTSAHDIKKYYGVEDKNMTVCYPGVDRRFTQQGKTYKGKHPYFLFVGALKRGKNIPLAIRAYSHILKNLRIDYDFLIIGGDFWMDPEIKETIRELGLEDRVKLLGFIPDSDIPSYYRGATALIMPSLWEGFCLPVAEAMACGCPVIANDIPIFREIVGKAGTLIPTTDEKFWVQAIQQAIHSNNRKYVKKFSWEKFARCVLDVIEKRP